MMQAAMAAMNSNPALGTSNPALPASASAAPPAADGPTNDNGAMTDEEAMLEAIRRSMREQ